jgi:hypothetical protein
MKYLVIILTVLLTGCASAVVQGLNGTMSTASLMARGNDANNKNKPKGGIPYEQLASIKVTQENCTGIDQNIDGVNQQLKLRGVYGKNPEELDEDDRKYNQAGKIIIWSMIIGCNNPDRYAQK